MIDYKIFFIRLFGLIAIISTVFLFIGLSIYFLPFLLAALVAMSIEPLIKYICSKIKINKKIIVAILVFIVYGVIGSIIVLVGLRLFKETNTLINIIPELYNKSMTMFDNNFKSFKEVYNILPDSVSTKIYEIGTDILSGVTKYVTDMVNAVVNFIMFLPTVIMYAIVTVLATYFVATDRNVIIQFISDTLPKRWYKNFVSIVNKSIDSILKYFKAEATLAGITFIGLVIAFLVTKQSYPFTIAILLGLLDILPVLGIGTAMIPWAIYCGITGNLSKGITLIVIYAILMIIRQLIEPKIISNSLGIKPIETLFSMFLGFKVMGILGIIAGPILCIILKDVFNIVLETGYIKSMFVEKRGMAMKYKISKNKK